LTISRDADFLLFIPTHSPGLKHIFNYYTTTVKLSAEGDVHLSDEALSGLGNFTQFLKNALFGAIIQIYDNPYTRTSRSLQHPMHTTRPPEYYDTDADYELDLYDEEHPAHLVYDDSDPHIPTKPARRKAAAPPPAQLQQHKARLTDFVPNLGYFAAGGLSGITSRTATAPLDRLKVYLIAQTGPATEAIQAAKGGAVVQATKHGASTLWNACKDLWAAGGIRSLFAGMCRFSRSAMRSFVEANELAGNGLNVIKVMPESAVKFGSYEVRCIAYFTPAPSRCMNANS
jgi:solute carrier family 25 phosphate transporter 23/24/25/41